MRYKTKDIGEEGLDLDLAFNADWLAQACPEVGDEVLAGGRTDGQTTIGLLPLRLRGRLERTGNDFLLHGSLRGTLVMPCGRCLEPARVPLDIPLSVAFVAKAPEGDEGGDMSGDDQGDFVVFKDDEIDVGDEVREELLLNLPMNPLCDVSCLGLCATCGQNRSKDPCDCDERQRLRASPFAHLAKAMKS